MLVRLDERGRVDEAVGKRRISRTRRWWQGGVPRVRLEVAVEDREMQMRAAAHARDVGERLTSLDRRTDAEPGAQPDVPVRRDDDTRAGLMSNQNSTATPRGCPV